MQLNSEVDHEKPFRDRVILFTDFLISDINECLRIPETMIKGHPCNQNCTNTLGSYTCSCKDGWDTAFGNDEYCRKTNLLQELAIILIGTYALLCFKILHDLSLFKLTLNVTKTSKIPCTTKNLFI